MNCVFTAKLTPDRRNAKCSSPMKSAKCLLIEVRTTSVTSVRCGPVANLTRMTGVIGRLRGDHSLKQWNVKVWHGRGSALVLGMR